MILTLLWKIAAHIYSMFLLIIHTVGHYRVCMFYIYLSLVNRDKKSLVKGFSHLRYRLNYTDTLVHIPDSGCLPDGVTP